MIKEIMIELSSGIEYNFIPVIDQNNEYNYYYCIPKNKIN